MSENNPSYMRDTALAMMGGTNRNGNSARRNASSLDDDAADDLDYISVFNYNGHTYMPFISNGLQCPSVMNQGPSWERQGPGLDYQRLGLEYQEPSSDYQSPMENAFGIQNQGNVPYGHQAGFDGEEPLKNNILLPLENSEATQYVHVYNPNVCEVGDLVDEEEEEEEDPEESESYNKLSNCFNFQDPFF